MLEQKTEGRGYGGLKLHALARDGVREAQQPRMQTETVQWVVAIAVLRVATHGMAHIGSMHTDLVLTSGLELELHQRVVGGAVHHKEMGDGQFAAIIHRR